MIVRCSKVNDAPRLSLTDFYLGSGDVDIDHFFLQCFIEIAPDVNTRHEFCGSTTTQCGREQRYAIFARRAALA